MKKVLITGGSDGLGKTIAQELSKEYEVIVIAKNEEKLKNVAEKIKCKYYVCDVSNYEEVDKLFKKIGKIDILINNAGLWVQEELDTNSFERIKDVISVNLLGVINCTKACLPEMKKCESGHIININSQAGINYKKERVVYNASKWGVTGFSKSLEDEVKKYGIKVTDIMPGKMKTDMFKKLNIEKSMSDGLETIQVAKLIKFILSLPKDVNIPEVGIKNILN